MLFFTSSCGKKGPLKLPLEKPPAPAGQGAIANEPEPLKRFVPSKVTGLEVFVTEDRVVLFWSENPEPVSGYRVLKAEEGGEFKEIALTQTPAFVDIGKLSKRRSYKVNAIGAEGEGEFSEPVTVSPQYP